MEILGKEVFINKIDEYESAKMDRIDIKGTTFFINGLTFTIWWIQNKKWQCWPVNYYMEYTARIELGSFRGEMRFDLSNMRYMRNFEETKDARILSMVFSRDLVESIIKSKHNIITNHE